MENEGPSHSEDSTEEAGFEDDIVSWRSLTRFRGRGRGGTGGRPVISCEHECGEIDFMRQFEEAFEGGGPGMKDVVQGSTCATSSRPRVSACNSFSRFPD